MKSRQMALCGLLTALAVVCMVLAGAMGIGTYLGPMLAMAVLLPLLEEYGVKTAAAYVAAALLGLLLAPDLELSLVYIAFGWYPLLRPRLNRLPSRPVRLAVKVLLAGGGELILYGVVLRLLGVSADLMDAAPIFNLLLFVLGVLAFLLLDLALGRLSILWRRKLRKRFFS